MRCWTGGFDGRAGAPLCAAAGWGLCVCQHPARIEEKTNGRRNSSAL